ncbi:peptidoglycan recognition protein family protein [Streptomyces sp. 8N616]|uniref:peptidoglycan recognition protein family protein n=1 Tax=Streptomyces sp. 8N616 TaxID=3457414 RepID=UPI003FD28DED
MAELSTKAGTQNKTFPKTRSALAKGTDAVETAFPVSYVGVRWAGEDQGPAIRFADADGSPGEWRELRAGCAAVNGVGTALVPATAATRYQIRAADSTTDVHSLALDTKDGPGQALKVPTSPTRVRGLEYLSRAAWGCDESKRFKPDGTENSPPEYYPVQTITVHHTDTPNDDPDPAATVRAIYEFHAITNDWGDIGYHFLIDEAGRIYEGRWSGTDGIPAHDAEGKGVTAFHTEGFNSGNIGIALMGTLGDRGPTDDARSSLIELIRILSRSHGLDPRGKTTFVNPVNGVKKDVNIVSGHRDWLQTDCPGGVMYGELEAVRAAASFSRRR